MELQHGGLERLYDGGEGRIIGIDAQCHLPRASAHLRTKGTGGRQRDMPRARLEEHEADHVDARIERRV